MSTVDTLLLVVVAVLLAAVVYLTLTARKPTDSATLQASLKGLSDSIIGIGEVKGKVESLETGLKALETRVIETTGQARQSLAEDLRGARDLLLTFKTEYESRGKMEEEVRAATQHIESIMAGSRTRGAAGENILREALKHFPPDMIETNFKVKGKPVEFALVLRDRRRVPIDSKWTGYDVLEKLDQEPQDRERIREQLGRAVQNKVKEVTKYIDPATTVPWAIAAVPDAVFEAAPLAHVDAFKEKVVLMPYSLALVYLLSLYHLHMEYAGSIDIGKLESYMMKIEDGVKKLEQNLNGRLSNAATQLDNAIDECRQAIGDMRAAIAYVHTLPASIPTSIDSGSQTSGSASKGVAIGG